LQANRVLIFRFQLLAVYVLLVHNCGECRIVMKHAKLSQKRAVRQLGRFSSEKFTDSLESTITVG
jgi:hypothetical protein